MQGLDNGAVLSGMPWAGRGVLDQGMGMHVLQAPLIESLLGSPNTPLLHTQHLHLLPCTRWMPLSWPQRRPRRCCGRELRPSGRPRPCLPRR